MSAMGTLARWDRDASLACNRANQRVVGSVFAVASRLGDGWFWFALMAVLPLVEGPTGARTTLAMLATGAVATALYKLMKLVIHRPRPCDADPAVRLTVPPLDRFSFPSGHTLHAVSFTVLVCGSHPGLVWLLAPFAALVALSRLVLGLHYLSDVLVGAVLGAALGTTGAALSAGI